MANPLSDYLRPQNIEKFVGQEHLIGDTAPISVFLKNKKIPSMIFTGPPGCGKTTLARIISNNLNADFFHLSGVSSKKEDLKKIIDISEQNQKYNKYTILFLDEIHRWNKAQQDGLLPYVENGVITMIGATTENPSFTINNALLSRCRTFSFEKINETQIKNFIKSNIDQIKSLYSQFEFDEDVLDFVADLGNGDLRTSINILESAILMSKDKKLTIEEIKKSGGKNLYYDSNAEEHYNIISAVHKSLRDSDPHGACYWIQRMLSGGEDPLYISRRLLRFASEDVGISDNNALLLANQVYDAVAKIGMPECDVFLIQLAIYLAKAPKNNIAYSVSIQTKKDVEKFGNLPVPMVIRNAPTKFMKEQGYGKGYKYAHNYKNAKVKQQHLPDELKGRKYF